MKQALYTVILLLFGLTLSGQQIMLTQLERGQSVEGSMGGQIGLTRTSDGKQRYAQYVEIELTPIGYTPTSTGNTLNLSEFVEDPSGDQWYIDWEGDAVMFTGGGSSLWTDAGAFTYLTATTDRALVGSATEINTAYQFQSNGGIFAKGTGLTAVTNTLKSADSGGTATFSVDDLGQSGFGKSVTLASGTNYATISTNATTLGGAGSLTITNGSGGSINSSVGFITGELIFAGSDAFTVGRGLSFNTLNNNTSTSNDITGVYASARGNTAGSRASKYTAISVDAYTDQTGGTVSEISAFTARFWGVNASGATGTSVYGMKLQDIFNAGTITNTFGYWVGDITTGTQSNQAYSFISTDANARQGFSGTTQIGGTGVPARTLHVVGETRISDLDTDAAAVLVGADGDGDLSSVPVSGDFSLSGGTLSLSGTGFWLQNGNTLGAALVGGTNDNNAVSLETNTVTRFTISSGASTGGDITATGVTANTNTVQDRLIITTESTAAGASAAFGSGVLFQGESATAGTMRDMARFSTNWLTATDISRTSEAKIQLVNSAAALADYFVFGTGAGTVGNLTIGSASAVSIKASGITTAQSFIIGQSANQLTLNTSLQSTTNAIALTVSATASGTTINASAAARGTATPALTLQTTSFTTAATNMLAVNIAGGYAPTAGGTATYQALSLTPTINQTGGHTGNTFGIDITPTLTAVGGTFTGLRLNYNSASAQGVDQVGELTTNRFDGRVFVERTTNGTGANNAFLNLNGGSITGNTEALRASANISTEWIGIFANTRNTGGTGDVRIEAQVGGTSAGDPYFVSAIPSGSTTVWGNDNSDLDKFKITPGGTKPGSVANKGMTFTQDAVTLVGINKDAPLHELHVEGIAMATLFVGKGDSWDSGNIAFGTGAGTGPSITTVHGHGNGFSILFTTGTTPTANGIVFTATLPTSFPSGVSCIPTFSAYNRDASATDFLKFKIDSQALNQFVFKAVGTLGASTSYGFNFQISGYDN